MPLSGLEFGAADWPAAQMAAEFLHSLGARYAHERQRLAAGVALSCGSRRVYAKPSTPREDLLASGIMDLTGRWNGPGLTPVGCAATVARAAGLAMSLLSDATGQPTIERLAQRARLFGLKRNGSTSVGGAARLLRARGGWFALSLPRESDVEMLPALLEVESGDCNWHTIAEWASVRDLKTIVQRAELLDLAVGALPLASSPTQTVPWTITARPASGRSRWPLRVVNLGALWAAPLCAQLLQRSGMQVVDLKSENRPEHRPQPFYNVLHDGHRTITCDFRTPDGRSQLASLLRGADVVIEASRPRALRALGTPAEVVMHDGRPRVWIQITGHGRESNRIAFGDDAAVAGGLVAWDRNGPVFAGDAMADPLTGILAALAALACVSAGGAWIIELPMVAVARFASRQLH